MLPRTYPVRHLILRVMAFAVVSLELIGDPSAARSEIPKLTMVDSLRFYSQLSNETYQQATFSDGKTSFPGPVQILGVTLGEQHSIAWVEQTPTDRVTRLRKEPSGVRVMQMNFGAVDHDAPAVSCVGGSVGNNAQVRQLPITVFPNSLQFKYWDATKPTSGELHKYSYAGSARRFIRSTSENDAQVQRDELAELPAVQQGQIELRSLTSKANSGCDRRYTLALDKSDGLAVTGTVEFVVGLTRISYTSSIAIDSISAELKSALQQVLAGKPLPETKLLTNGNMVCMWFPGAKTQALVIDLERMEREFLIGLIADTQELINKYDFSERQFLQASYILGRLNLITRFASSISAELGTAETSRVRGAAVVAIAEFEDLIFRLPVQVDNEKWTFFYNTRTNKGRLVPAELNWAPISGQAFQLKIANRPLTFLMILKSSKPMVWTSEQLALLKDKLAEDNRFEQLRSADIQLGLPKQASAALANLEKSGDRKSTIRLQDFRVVQPDVLALKLTASESDAQELRELYLRSSGLPLQISLESYFHTQRSSDDQATIECRVKAPDFKVLSAQDQFLPITVLVDAAIFGDDSEQFKVRLRYPGESQEFSGFATKKSGTATLEIPVRTKQSEIQLEVQYWSPSRLDWVTEATGMEGLIIIDR